MSKYNKKAVELADFIEANPNCKFVIDNDYWCIRKLDDDCKEDDDENELTRSRHFEWSTEWYSDSSNYGAGLAEAMVILLNRRGFKIEASAV